MPRQSQIHSRQIVRLLSPASATRQTSFCRSNPAFFFSICCRLAPSELNDAAAAAAAVAAAANTDADANNNTAAEISAQLVVLKKLQTDGVISSEEFENKKAELLGRM